MLMVGSVGLQISVYSQFPSGPNLSLQHAVRESDILFRSTGQFVNKQLSSKFFRTGEVKLTVAEERVRWEIHVCAFLSIVPELLLFANSRCRSIDTGERGWAINFSGKWRRPYESRSRCKRLIGTPQPIFVNPNNTGAKAAAKAIPFGWCVLVPTSPRGTGGLATLARTI